MTHMEMADRKNRPGFQNAIAFIIAIESMEENTHRLKKTIFFCKSKC